MGLNCSRQGYIRDFHELQDTRIAPEGQCFQVDLLKSNDNTNGSHGIQEKLTALLQDDKLAKRLSVGLCINNFDNERILYGREDGKKNDFYVGLPPEGKACNDFVELPKEKHRKQSDGSTIPLFVDLPAESCDVEESNLRSQMQSNNNLSTQLFDNKYSRKNSSNTSKLSSLANHNDSPLATNDGEHEDDDQWMYTLYDFQENGIVTKQDVNRLMDSICSVVNSTLSSEHTAPHESLHQSNNLKVHLEISRRKKSSNRHQCQSSRDFHGTQTIHSRPATDKTSLSNRFLSSKSYNGLIFPPPNSEEAEKVSSYIEDRLLNHRRRRISHEKNNKHPNNEILPSSSTSTCRRCSAHSSKTRSLTRSPVSSYAAHRTEQNIDRYNKRRECKIVTTKPLLHHPSTNEHYKTRNGSCDVSNSDHSLSPSSMSGTNTPFSCDEVFSHRDSSDKESIAVSENSRFRHSCSCRRKPKLRSCDNIFENKYSKTTSKSKHFQSNSSHSSSQDENSTTALCQESTRQEQHESLKDGRSEHRKKLRRHTEELRQNVRPDVWPGRAASVVSNKASVKEKNLEGLCFCKRMMGHDYPCNHSL